MGYWKDRNGKESNLKCEYGEDWPNSAGWIMKPIRTYCNWYKRRDQWPIQIQYNTEKIHMNSVGQTLHENSILMSVLEGKIEGQKNSGRPVNVMLNWMIDQGNRCGN